jgi:hypothetical protein
MNLPVLDLFCGVGGLSSRVFPWCGLRSLGL